jgi:hypothetical protein
MSQENVETVRRDAQLRTAPPIKWALSTCLWPPLRLLLAHSGIRISGEAAPHPGATSDVLRSALGSPDDGSPLLFAVRAARGKS